MAENAFRTQLSSFRQSTPTVATNETEGSFLNRVQSWNPFGPEGTLNTSRYIRLPLTEREETTTVEEPAWFTLSRWDRLLVFGICLVGAVACFALCFAILPILALKPRKFAVLWTLGSLLFVVSFGVLQGPMAYLMHLFSPNRLIFTVAYFGSIVATLVFSMGMKSTILTILAVIVQVIAALWYAVSYFPMGTQSLKFASRIGARQMTSWINS
jgi:hypothetical protein